MGQSEPELVAAAQGGDREAFDELVRANFSRVYSIAFRLVGNHEDAEDLAQECFVRAHRSLAHFRGESSLATWLARIVVHQARDRRRRELRGPELVALERAAYRATPSSAQPEQVARRRELTATVTDALSGLPQRLRAALVLRVIEGLDYDEVAEITGVRPGTARTQVMKARRVLLRVLGPWLEGSPRE